MRRACALFPAVWLLTLLLLPGMAFLAGARQANLENRPKTPIPDLNRGTLRRDATFKQLDAAILDRLPLRGTALELRSRLVIDLLHQSPNSEVLIGSAHWLYYRPELRSCTDEGRPAGDPADAAEILARTLTAAGRRATVVVAGSKLTVARRHAPDVSAALLHCVIQTEGRVHERLAKTPGGLDIQPRLLDLERRGIATFLRSDTHWDYPGRRTFAEAILERIRPGLAKEVGLTATREVEAKGDLSRFIGRHRYDRTRGVLANRLPSPPFAPGSIVFVGDSQLDNVFGAPGDASALLGTVFAGQPVCRWDGFPTGQCDALLKHAHTLVLEIVGRDLDGLVAQCWRPVALTAYALPTRPAAWADGSSGTRPVDPAGTPIRLRGVGPDIASIPRIMRLPIRRLPAGASPGDVKLLPDPQTEPTACATPDASTAGSLLLPVPAGTPASAVGATVTAPAGTILGRPEQLTLGRTRHAT